VISLDLLGMSPAVVFPKWRRQTNEIEQEELYGEKKNFAESIGWIYIMEIINRSKLITYLLLHELQTGRELLI
jgi:hypothetical protein